MLYLFTIRQYSSLVGLVRLVVGYLPYRLGDQSICSSLRSVVGLLGDILSLSTVERFSCMFGKNSPSSDSPLPCEVSLSSRPCSNPRGNKA